MPSDAKKLVDGKGYIQMWELAKLKPSLFVFRAYFTLRKADDWYYFIARQGRALFEPDNANDKG